MPNETIIPAAILTAAVSLLKAYHPAQPRLETALNADAASIRAPAQDSVAGLEVR